MTPKRPEKLYAVELFHPTSWRIAMSIEMAGNVYPLRRLADAAASRYRRNGYRSRVVVYVRAAKKRGAR